jgi:thiol:disulfide interchange protein DsbD
MLWVCGGTTGAQMHKGVQLVDAKLVSSVDAMMPGKPFLVGLHMKMAPHWHTYWQYPGDSGLATSIDWGLPPGFKAGPIQWPLPKRIDESGLTSFAYEDETLLIVEITPPENVAPEAFVLKAKAKWLVCSKICIPGEADVALALPVKSTSAPVNEELFTKHVKLLPRSAPPEVQAKWAGAQPKEMRLEVRVDEGWNVTGFFPLPPDSIQIGAPNAEVPESGRGSDYVVPIIAPTDYRGGIPGVLGVIRPDGSVTAITVDGTAATPLSTSNQPSAGTSGRIQFVELGGGSGDIGLFGAMLSAILGGLLLNLMPCVLPAISLKIFGFVEQAGESRAKIFQFGAAFVAGIFTWFGLLAVLAMILKSRGVDLNWGFMFQNPWLILAMGSVVLVFALNLFGVFEIVLPGSTATALSEASSKKGLAGSFVHGIFATMLATPCTAPFLGAALGFAFTQPLYIIPLVFAGVATGMSLPYLLLAIQPAWLSALPKPGPWMERLKQFLGFLMLAVLVALLWLLAQRGPDAVGWALAIYLLLAVACWVVGASLTPVSSARAKRIGFVGVLAALGLIGWTCVAQGEAFDAQTRPKPAAANANPMKVVWKDFSASALDAALKDTARPVFIDFTADWCLTCKVNERGILDRDDISTAFKSADFTMFKADWTDGDPEITEYLKKFRRNGVPLYVFYPSDRTRPPIVLPELITPGIVLDGIRQALGERS